jgi:Bacterial Ig-like domain
VDDTYTFTADTTDVAGNVADTASVSWTVDSTKPALSVTGLPADGGLTAVTSYSPSVADVDAHSSGAYTCKLNGAASSCTTLGPLADGAYTFTADTTDLAGNAATTLTRSWTVDATAPTATFQAPLTLNGKALVMFSEPISGLSPTGTQLRLTGGAVVPTTATCFQLAATVPCTTAGVTSVSLQPTKLLVPGQHYTVSFAAAAGQDAASNLSVAAAKDFRGQRVLQENTAPVTTTLQKVKTRLAFGKSYVRGHLARAQSSWKFRGKSITWWTVRGPAQGKATVFVDGHKKRTVNNYATANHYRVARTFKRLGRGQHTITIRVLGVKGAKAGKGTYVAVDAFTVGKKRTPTPKLVMSWHRARNSHFFSRHATVADLAGETVSLRFRGTSLTWTTIRNRSQGKAAIYVDGVRKGVWDNYSSTARYKVRRLIRHLSDKVHTVRIVVLGKHHKGGRGNTITIDRFAIG